MAKRPKLIPFGDDAWTFKGAKHPYVSKKKARKARNKMYPKVKYKKVTILYNVRDAAGKMVLGVTSTQKDKIVKAGGTVVNVIRPRGYKPPPPEEEVVAPEEEVVAPEEEVVAPEVVVAAPPEVKVETPAQKAARLAAVQEALITRLGPVAAAAEIASMEALEVAEPGKLDVEPPAPEWFGPGVMEEDVVGVTPSVSPLEVQIIHTTQQRDTSAKNIPKFEKDIVTFEQNIITATQDKDGMIAQYGEITAEYHRVIRHADDYKKGSIVKYKAWYDQYVKDYNSNLEAYDKYISDLEAGIDVSKQNIGIEQTNVRVMDKWLAWPEKGAQYVVTYTEGGVEKTETFDSEVEANVFHTLLDKITVNYTENGVPKTKTFKTQAGADDFVKMWQDGIMADAKFTGTWAAFETQQTQKQTALIELYGKGLIEETEPGTYELTKQTSSMSKGDLETAKVAGFDPVYRTPWMEQLFPQLADLRDKAEFQRFPLWDSMTDQEKKDLILSSSRGRMEPVPWETSAARLQYAAIYATEGAAIAGAVGALVATVPQLGVPIAASMVLGTVATLATEKGREVFLDYVKQNPEAFASEVLGGVFGSAIATKVIKARQPQMTEVRELSKVVEGAPLQELKKTIPTAAANIDDIIVDPITGEELILGKLTEVTEARTVLNRHVALKYGAENFAKLMNNEALGEHMVTESLMPLLDEVQIGYLLKHGYTKAVMSNMTGLELAQTLYKELGALGFREPSLWANIPEGIFRKGGGTLEVLGILRPLTKAQASALVGQGVTVYTTMTAGGVPQSLALQATTIAMNQGAASAYVFAQLSGQASVEMLAVIEASLAPVAAKMFSTTSKGSFTQTLRDLGLSDSEALMVTTELIKSDSTANILKSLKTLKVNELKGYVTTVDQGLLLKTIPKLDLKTTQKVVNILDTKTIIELAPKIDTITLNSLIVTVDKARLDEVISKLDKATINKLDDKTISTISKELLAASWVTIIPRLDKDKLAKVFPKLDLDKKEIRDMLDKLDAKTKKNIEDVLVKLDSKSLKNVILKLNKDFVSDIDKQNLKSILEDLDRETLEKFVTRYGVKSVARTIDKEMIEYASELLRLLRGDTRKDVIDVLTDDTIAKVITEVESKEAADLLSGLSKERMKTVINKLKSDKITDLFRLLRGDRRDDVIAVLSDNTIAELVSRFTKEESTELLSKIDKVTLDRVIPKLDTKTLTSILPIEDVYTRIDTTLLKAALARLDEKDIVSIMPAIITKLDSDTITDIIPIIGMDVLVDILSKLDTSVMTDVIVTLDTDVISDIMNKLDQTQIEDVITVLSDTVITDIITTVDTDTIYTIITSVDDIQIQRIVPLLEKVLPPRDIKRIRDRLPPRLRRKFDKARRRPPPKIFRSKEPEPYKIGFRYHTGAGETERVDAHTFHEALVIAEKRKKIKLVPVEVEVEKLELRR